MNRLGSFGRAVAAETLKIRKTLALWLVSVLSAAPVGLQLLVQLNGSNSSPGQVDPWIGLGFGVLMIWTLFVLPLFVALETGLLAGIEHSADGWKQLFALPVHRGPVYAAKISMAVVLVAAAHVMLFFWTLVAGEIMAVFRPDLGFTWIPPGELLTFIAASFIGSWLMIAIHGWISLRWSSLVLNVGIAILALVVSLSIVESDLSRFNPWFIPTDLTVGIFNRLLGQASQGGSGEPLQSILISVLGGMLVCVLAVTMLRRRDVY